MFTKKCRLYRTKFPDISKSPSKCVGNIDFSVVQRCIVFRFVPYIFAMHTYVVAYEILSNIRIVSFFFFQQKVTWHKMTVLSSTMTNHLKLIKKILLIHINKYNDLLHVLIYYIMHKKLALKIHIYVICF